MDILYDVITGILLLIFSSVFIQLAENLCFILLSHIPSHIGIFRSAIINFINLQVVIEISLALTEVSVVDSSVGFCRPVESAGSHLQALCQ